MTLVAVAGVSPPGNAEIVARLLVAAVLGAAIGAERESGGKDAGLRTHLVLALGAALFGVISVGAWTDFMTSAQTNVRIDVTRVASYVAAGIGFLGGGAILKEGGNVKGLTTAASLWIAAGVGLATGVGLWAAAIAGTIVALVSLFALRPLRRVLRRLGSEREATVRVVLRSQASPSAVLRELEETGLTPRQVSVGHTDGVLELVAVYESAEASVLSALATRVGNLDSVSEVHIGRPP